MRQCCTAWVAVAALGCLVGTVAAHPAEPCRRQASHELVLHTAAVERLLRSVSDKESADRAAKGLRTEFEAMKAGLEKLAVQGAENPADMQELARTMRRLTYMTQSYIPIIKRLDEVNAYGSEELLTVLHLYKQAAGTPVVAPVLDSPVLAAYTDWEDALSNVLYHLRKVQSPAAAASSLQPLQESLRCLQAAHFAVQPFCGVPLSEPEQRELAPLLTHIEKQRAAFHAEKDRITAARCYNTPELQLLLEALEQATE